MDSGASLALATESPSDELLLRKPHNRNEYIISPSMFKHIFGQAIYQFSVMMILTFLGEYIIPEIEDDLDVAIQKNIDLTTSDFYKFGNY